MPSRIPWSWGNLSEGEAVPGYLNRVLSDLEQYLRLVHDELTFGPVAGSYLCLHLCAQNTVGTTLSIGVQDRMTFAFTGQILYAQMFVQGGGLTANLLTGPGALNSIFTGGGRALTSNTSTFWDRSTDFVKKSVAESLVLEVDSIDADTPWRLSARVILKNVSKIDAS